MSEPLSSDTMLIEEPGIGLLLRQQREALGWRIEDVAEHLKIRPVMIKALEEEDYAVLPGRTYLLGFLKSYASFLNLDATTLVVSFCRDKLGSVEIPAAQVPRLSFLQMQEERSVSVTALIGAGLVVVAAAYAGWYYFAQHDVPARYVGIGHKKIVEAMLPHHEVVQPSLPATPAPLELSAAPAPSELPAAPVPSELPAAPLSPEVNALPLSPAAVQAETVPSPFIPHQEIPPVTVVASASAPASSITLHAVQESWVKIKDAHGAVVFVGNLKPGGQWHGEDSAGPYHIETGNAGGLYLQAGTVQTAPLGGNGKVSHGLVVDVQGIDSGHFGYKTDVPLPNSVSPALQKNPSASPFTPMTLGNGGASH